MSAGRRPRADDPLVNPLLDRRVADAEPACGLPRGDEIHARKNRIDTLENQAKFAVNCIDDFASRAWRSSAPCFGTCRGAARADHGCGRGQPDRSRSRRLPKPMPRPAAARCGSTSPGSNVLARQIVNGAPADVFISADEAQMDVVEKAGAVLAGSRVDLVGNQLAVVATPERVELVRQEFARAPAEIRRLAIGDPAAVPAGVYARRYLEQQGLWAAVRAAGRADDQRQRGARRRSRPAASTRRSSTSPISPPLAPPCWRSPCRRGRAAHRLSGRDSCVVAQPGRGEAVSRVPAPA